MSKIVIVGGTSELGNEIANQALMKSSHDYNNIVRLSSTSNDGSSINWNIDDIDNVNRSLQKINVSKGDLIIVAIGTLTDVWSKDKSKIDPNSIQLSLHVNTSIPIFSISYFYNELLRKGGGKIVLLSSVAGFPILSSNFIYGLTKSTTDQFARFLQKNGDPSVEISIVRSGFVKTKLNQERKPTPFSISKSKFGHLVLENMHKDVIWTPAIFKLISYVLRKSSFLRKIANKKALESRS